MAKKKTECGIDYSKIQDDDYTEIAIDNAKSKETKLYKTYRNSPVIGDGGISASPGEIADITRNALAVGTWPKIDINNPKQVSDRVTDYFNYCIDHEIRPGNMGLYNALWIDKRRISDIVHNTGNQKFNPDSVDVIKKSLTILSEIREQLMSSGKLNPITGIFWQKNYEGLSDKQEIVITPNNQPENVKSLEELRKEIPEIPIDEEEQ